MSPGGDSAFERGGPARFLSTAWSVVREAQDPAGELYRQSLSELCSTYWKPVYAFVRRRGQIHDEQAQGQIDLVRSQTDPAGRVHQLEHLANDPHQIRIDSLDGLRLVPQGSVRVFHDLQWWLLHPSGFFTRLAVRYRSRGS